MKKTCLSLVLTMVTALAICVAIPYKAVFAQEKTHYTHRTTCESGAVIEVPVVCTPDTQFTIEVRCPGENADRVTWMCPSEEKEWFHFGLRAEGGYSHFLGPSDNRDIWSSDMFGVLQFPHILGVLGFEMALGGGGSYFPNRDKAFHGTVEVGPVFDLGRYFQLMAGYRAEWGTVTNDGVLQRHAGILRLRWLPIRSFAVEAMFSPGWGLQVSKSTHEEWVGDEGWRVDDTFNHRGWTPSASLGVTWFIR